MPTRRSEMGNPVAVMSKFYVLDIDRNIHRFAFSPSNFAKSLMRPMDLHAIMAIMQTTDYGLLAEKLQIDDTRRVLETQERRNSCSSLCQKHSIC